MGVVDEFIGDKDSKEQQQDADSDFEDKIDAYHYRRRVVLPKDERVKVQTSEYYPDTEIELEGQMINPHAQKRFDHINRDIKLSNLGDLDVLKVEALNDVIEYLEMIEMELKKRYEGNWELKSKRLFEARLHTLTNTRAAYKGFTAKIMRTNIQVGVSEDSWRRYEEMEGMGSGESADLGLLDKLRKLKGRRKSNIEF